MLDKTIKLSEKYNSSSLITRQAARELFIAIAETKEERIILDFSNIEFASRSFFDELNSQMNKANLLGKNIKLISIDENIKKLYDLVVKASKSKTSISYSSVANADVITI